MVRIFRRRDNRVRGREARIPAVLRILLEVPLETKLLGANLIIVAVAGILLFGPVRLEPTRAVDASIVVAALIVAALVNSVLVRVALHPISALERVAKWVAEGRLSARIPTSVVADHELTRLSTTINKMLDSLAADRERIQKFDGQVIYAGERARAQIARELHDSVARILADARFQLATSVNEIESNGDASRLEKVQELLRAAIDETRNVSRSAHLGLLAESAATGALASTDHAAEPSSLADVFSGIHVPGGVGPDRPRVLVRQDIRDIDPRARGMGQR
jgi:signal transduction histidine kinase